jgi:hypothetical protein
LEYEDVALLLARLSEYAASSAVNSPYPWWHSTPARILNVHSVPAGFDVQLSARSGSMNSGLILPGRTRTRPLNIQLSRPLSGVVEAICGSSLPASAEPMPTTRLFFCAKAGCTNISAAHTMASTIFFIDVVLLYVTRL